MLLTSFDPFVAEFDRLAQWAFGTADAGSGRAAVRMDVVRRNDDIEFRFDLPGIDPESIEVTVDRGVLTVGARRAEEYADGDKPVIRERVMGAYTRQVRLPDAVDASKVEASYVNGVLTVRAPLAPEAKPRKIEIRTDAKALGA